MKKNLIATIRSQTPLVHNITNYVTVNDVANIILACGGSPIMADEPKEVEEITSICQALNINIGTLNERTIPSMLKAGKRASALGHVTVLDPVGAGASILRTSTAQNLMKEIPFSVIRGNVSELKALSIREESIQQGTINRGVDVSFEDMLTGDNLDEMIHFTKAFSKKTGAIIAMTGAIDIVADSEKVYLISNGNPLMSKITGTGCMLNGVIASYCSVNQENLLEATAMAVAAMGLCGEIGFHRLEEGAGTSSYRTYIIDAMSHMDDKTLEEGMKIEIR